MRHWRFLITSAMTISMLVTGLPAYACSNFLVTSGASVDGSTMITYTCDGEFHPHLDRSRARPGLD